MNGFHMHPPAVFRENSAITKTRVTRSMRLPIPKRSNYGKFKEAQDFCAAHPYIYIYDLIGISLFVGILLYAVVSDCTLVGQLDAELTYRETLK